MSVYSFYSGRQVDIGRSHPKWYLDGYTSVWRDFAGLSRYCLYETLSSLVEQEMLLLREKTSPLHRDWALSRNRGMRKALEELVGVDGSRAAAEDRLAAHRRGSFRLLLQHP